MKYYFSFGFGHAHCIEGMTYDRNCLVEVETEEITDSPEAAMKARLAFMEFLGEDNKRKWAFQRTEAEYAALTKEKRNLYFPRGVIKQLKA